MKPRTVLVVLELATDLPLSRLRRQDVWQKVADDHKTKAGNVTNSCNVRQVTATVQQPAKGKVKQ